MPLQEQPCIIWNDDHWISSHFRYSQLLQIMTDDYTFCLRLSELIDSSYYDIYARIVMGIFHRTNQAIGFLKKLLKTELATGSSETQRGCLLRGASLAPKAERFFVRQVGTEYLKQVVGPIITAVLESESDIEIDPSRLLNVPENTLDTNTANLIRFCDLILDKIVDPNIVSAMPREIRAIAGLTGLYAKRYVPDQWESLVGGFIFLRFFVPSLVTPEAYGLLPEETILGAVQRRRLILLSKLLQCISNGVTTSKEAYFSRLHDYVRSKQKLITAYFGVLITDSLLPTAPWNDQLTAQKTVLLDVFTMNLFELFELHRIIHSCFPKLMDIYSSTPSEGAFSSSDIMGLLKELGTPPPFSEKREEGVNDPLSFDDKSLDVKFLYQYSADKQGLPVFYFIAHHLRDHFLLDAAAFVRHIEIILNPHVLVPDNPYVLVFDMSWMDISPETHHIMFSNALRKIWKLFSYNLKKNLKQIYILHPNSVTKTILFFLRHFVSRKFFRKVHQVYDVTQLTRHISKEKIGLPESSTKYITKSYRVTKINAKGKRQQRIIKFTSNSLLNLDYKNNVLKNEKKLDEIKEIIIPSLNSKEIVLTFKSSTQDKTKGIRPFFSNSKDLLRRVYGCLSLSDRNSIIQDIFERGFQLSHSMLSENLRVRMTFTRLKDQKLTTKERVLKPTIDSLLVMKNNKILMEISMAGIDDISRDPSKKEILLLKLKSDDAKWKIEFETWEQAWNLLESVKKGIKIQNENNDSFFDIFALQQMETTESLSLSLE